MRKIEQQYQVALVSWFGLSYPKFANLLIQIPNEGKRSLVGNVIMKRMGLKKGASDLFLSVPSSGYHGFFIELKQKGKKPTKEQYQFIENVKGVGYKAEWYDDWILAKKDIALYLCKAKVSN